MTKKKVKNVKTTVLNLGNLEIAFLNLTLEKDIISEEDTPL